MALEIIFFMVANMARNLASIVSLAGSLAGSLPGSLAGSLADIVRSLAGRSIGSRRSARGGHPRSTGLAGKQTWFAKCSNYYYYYFYATQNDNKSIQTVDDIQIKSINSIFS
jgi:hypothetical protein